MTVPRYGWLYLAVLYLACVAITFLTRPVWQHDTLSYLSWTYRYLGYSDADAARLTIDFARQFPDACTSNARCDYDRWPELFSGVYAKLVGPRIITPLLSAPFVALLGPWGMAVLPFVSYTLAIVVVVVLAHRLFGQRLALLAGVLMVLPVPVARFGVHTYTEAPATLFAVAALLFLPIGRKPRRLDLLWFLLLVELGLFTRQFNAVTVAGVALAWLVVTVRDRALRNPWLPFMATGMVAGVATVYFQMRMFAGDSGDFSYQDRIFEHTGTDTFGELVQVLPNLFYRNVWLTDWSYLRTDVTLVVVLTIGLLAVVTRFRSELSAIAVGMAVTTYAFNALEMYPAYFRYHVPAYPIYLLAALALVADLYARPRRAPWRSTEAVPGTRWAGPVERPTAWPDPDGRLAWLYRRVVGQSLLAWAALSTLTVGALATVAAARPQWGSGSRYHLAWTFRVLGLSPGDAAERVRDVMQPMAALQGATWPEGHAWLFAGDAAANGPGLAYVVLSAPFVALLGPWGMLAVSALAYLGTVALVTRLGTRLWGSRWGLLVGAATATVAAVAGWGGHVGPHALTAFAGVVALQFLPLARQPRRIDPLWAGCALLVALLNQTTALSLAAAVVVCWLAVAARDWRVRNPWLRFAAASAVVTGVAAAVTWLLPGRQFIVGADTPGPLVPTLARQLVQTVVNSDRMLVAVVLLAVASMVLRWRSELTALAAGAGLTAIVLQLLMGTAAGFQPVLVTFPLLGLAAVALAVDVWARQRPPRDGHESPPQTTPHPSRPRPAEVTPTAV